MPVTATGSRAAVTVDGHEQGVQGWTAAGTIGVGIVLARLGWIAAFGSGIALVFVRFCLSRRAIAECRVRRQAALSPRRTVAAPIRALICPGGQTSALLMAWTVSKQSLLDGLAARRRRASERPHRAELEMLARAARWTDEVAESCEAFRRAAQDVIERVENRGRGDARSRVTTAGFFAMAGDLSATREWGIPAAEALVRKAVEAPISRESLQGNIREAIATLYVCREWDRAVELSREFLVRDVTLQLLWAERNRDVRACDLAIERIARWIVAGRAAPFQASGWPGPIDPWDWLEIGFEVQARIAEEPVPTHTLMLERAGLLGPGPSRRVARPQPGGIDRIPVTGADGARIEVVFDRRDSELIHIALDPRDEPPYEFYLVLSFYWDGAAYRIHLYTAPMTSHQDILPYEGPDFREAIEAAADWLDRPEIYGRDGTWAARTLLEVTQEVRSPDR